ncbi:MAG: hypothetical protein BroJett029_04470 [Alphaproteobacteria bacterium]|nr:MAG: hypothetical protein BroJett029_04470 [Alphaproteobacteria bacterium]
MRPRRLVVVVNRIVKIGFRLGHRLVLSIEAGLHGGPWYANRIIPAKPNEDAPSNDRKVEYDIFCQPSCTGTSFGRNFMIAPAIAGPVFRDYSQAMRLGIPCRWLGLCLVMALTLGLAGHDFATAEMQAKMMTAAAAGEMSSSSDGCNGCTGGGDGMLSAGCFAICGGVLAVLPAAAPIKSTAVDSAVPVAAPFHIGQIGPPDPSPPRPSVLS